MLRYENAGQVINVRLPEPNHGYSVECTYLYDKNEDNYSLTMGLKRDDINTVHVIDTQYITSDKGIVKHNICRIVTQMYESGILQDYIDEFEKLYEHMTITLEFIDTLDTLRYTLSPKNN